MERSLPKAVVGAALVVTLGAFAAGCDGSSNKHNDASTTSTTLVAGNGNYINPDAYCVGTSPIEDDAYIDQVGGQAIPNIGVVGPNNISVFSDTNPNDQNTKVAKKLEGDDLALAIISTIESAKTGLTPQDIASEAAIEKAHLDGNEAVREQTCESIIGDVLNTPNMFTFHSPTGLYVAYSPNFTQGVNKVYDGIDGGVSTEGSDITVFNTQAANQNDALSKSITESWGITAAGAIIQWAATNQGNVEVNQNGTPVAPNTSSLTTIPSNESSSTSTGNKAGSTSGSGGGGTKKSPDNQANNGTNTGHASGGNGNSTSTGTTPANGSGNHSSPSGGGSGTTTGTSPTTTEGSGSSTTSTTEVPVTTTTIPSTTTTTGSKGAAPTSVPCNEYNPQPGC